VLLLALPLQKDIAKTLLLRGRRAGAGRPGPSPARSRQRHLLPPPYEVKPVAEGSSVGVFIVREAYAPSRRRN